MTSNQFADPINVFGRDEYEFLTMFLDGGAEDFSNKSCNDFVLSATSTNRAIVSEIILFNDPDQDQLQIDEIETDEGELFVYDDWAMAFFAKKCELIFQAPQSSAALTVEELKVLRELLLLIAENNEDVSDPMSFNLTLPANDFHIGLCERVSQTMRPKIDRYVSPEFRLDAQSILTQLNKQLEVASDGSDLDVPDFWIMYYFAEKISPLAA